MNDLQTMNLLKGLVIDGVNAAKSGHPGGAMSSMDFAYLLFTEAMQFDPEDPKWLGRDRFILSAGHESMLIYSLLQGIGWLPMDELKQFRQLHSKTPGHPENTETPGVECTTGPLGQGCAMSLGFAVASSHMQTALNPELFDYHTWVLLGDGCMQEDITLGAASLAGHLKLANLVWYYDKNKAQISGKIDRSTSDDEVKVFQGFGWHIIEIDGHNHDEIRSAIASAKACTDKPTLIVGNTTMAKGAASLEGDHGTHGAPLPQDERSKTKSGFGIPDGEEFYWPETASKHFQRNFDKRREEVKAWNAKKERLLKDDASFKSSFASYFERTDFTDLPEVKWEDKPLATRNAFGDVLEKWATEIPNLMGGSADLEPSNCTGAFAKIVKDFQAGHRGGRNLAFGVREFPMSALANGLALHGGIIPFDATFLAFADYSRPALRLGAIQRVRVIHEFTHDSFYLGEDGPTHQPIEQVMSLRLMPDMHLMRPADARETQVLMRQALELNLPSSICLTRQKLPMLPVTDQEVEKARKGAYFVKKAEKADTIIFASGSEVSLALACAEEIETTGKGHVTVVSTPCWETFFKQDKSYRDEILSRKVTKRVSIEAGCTSGWERFVGMDGLTIGIDHYGASAPAGELEKLFGFTKEAVVGKFLEHTF